MTVASTVARCRANTSGAVAFGSHRYPDGQVDQARTYWLTHPALDAAELRLAPDLAALVATRRFPAE